MQRRDKKCHVCGGQVTEERETVDYPWGDDLLAIVEGVPAGICGACGERYFTRQRRPQRVAQA